MGLLVIFYSDYSTSCYMWEVIVVNQRWLIMHGLRSNRVHNFEVYFFWAVVNTNE